jgi:putative lipoprotein (rSAM/lipoprotein system)
MALVLKQNKLQTKFSTFAKINLQSLLMKTKLLKSHNIALAKFLAILGFGACIGTACVKYGAPSADYMTNGKVVSEESQQPIEGILVKSDSFVFTDSLGNYVVHDHAGYGLKEETPPPHTSYLTFRDTANQYNDLDTFVKFEKGKTSRTLNIALTPKTNTDESEN